MTKQIERPTNEDIDVLCEEYQTAQQSAENARKRESDLREELMGLVEQFGAVPRRATKSKRLEGDEFQVTLSKGHSVEVNSNLVEQFRQWMKTRNMSRLFRKLFKRELLFVAQEGAAQLVERAVSELGDDAEAVYLCVGFHRCMTIKDTSPTVKVESRKKEKEEKKSEAAA